MLMMVAQGRGGYSRKFCTGLRLCLFTAEIMTDFPTLSNTVNSWGLIANNRK